MDFWTGICTAFGGLATSTDADADGGGFFLPFPLSRRIPRGGPIFNVIGIWISSSSDTPSDSDSEEEERGWEESEWEESCVSFVVEVSRAALEFEVDALGRSLRVGVRVVSASRTVARRGRGIDGLLGLRGDDSNFSN